MARVYVFVDHSNIWIQGKRVSGRSRLPPLASNYNYRLEYGKLLQYVCAGRHLGDAPRLYGSEQLRHDAAWDAIRAHGYKVNICKRNFFGKEKGVDMRMGMDIARLVYCSTAAETLVIVTGDADFVPVVEVARAQGWRVELCYWSKAAQKLRAAVDAFRELDSDVYSVGFDLPWFPETTSRWTSEAHVGH